MRTKDNTLITCKLCEDTVQASGMGSHLYHKHDKTTSEEYVNKFGEFRRKYLNERKRKEVSGIYCQICNESMMSHKHLLHHIHTHSITWQEYFIKYFFYGNHPTCSCGCGEKVKLIRHGKNEKNETVYARSILPGHNNNPPGYRSNNLEQRLKMREAAIKRMESKIGTFFNNGPSKGEIELQNFVKSLVPECNFQDRTILSGLELDIVIPAYKIAFEYNGGYFHSDLHKNKTYHLKKSLEAANQGYKVIHIWECDWYTRKDILKSMIKNQLGKTDTTIYARKTKILPLSPINASDFYRSNHLQGAAVGKYHYGLYYGDTLVSAMSFSSLRKATGLNKKENCYELIRYCNALNTTVVGGASKLFKYFIKIHTPEVIISYANFDWSTGNLYEKLEMQSEGRTPPGYFYTKSKYRFSRFQFQKHRLVARGADPTKTEYEVMISNGYARIWDCGNLKYKWGK